MLKKKMLMLAISVVVLGFTGLQVNAQEIEGAQSEITGTVSDASTFTALANVEIAVDGVILAVSDEEGNFTISNVEAGSYTLSVNHEGYDEWSDTIEVGEEGSEVSIELTPAEEF